jgi:predicted nucleic acid-binding protein
MKYLVDANVLSEATNPSPDEQVTHWSGCMSATSSSTL